MKSFNERLFEYSKSQPPKKKHSFEKKDKAKISMPNNRFNKNSFSTPSAVFHSVAHKLNFRGTPPARPGPGLKYQMIAFISRSGYSSAARGGLRREERMMKIHKVRYVRTGFYHTTLGFAHAGRQALKLKREKPRVKRHRIISHVEKLRYVSHTSEPFRISRYSPTRRRCSGPAIVNSKSKLSRTSEAP